MACDHTCGTSEKSKTCISKVPIFSQLSLEEMHEMEKLSRRKHYVKGELIFGAGEPSKHLFIIHKGRVKIYRLSATGKEQIIRVLGTGDFMGELALFTKKNSTCFAEVLEDTEVCTFYQKDVHYLIMKHPSITLKILEVLSNRLDQEERLLEEVTSEAVEKRAASYLVNLATNHPTFSSSRPIKLTLPMSKKDLASYIGTSRETLSRKLSAFQRQGLINQSGQRTITILNYNHLLQEAGE